MNGDGIYNPETERFYYVSDYYNTNTKLFEDDTAVLIYYNNVSAGSPSNNTTYAYDSSGEKFHGPRTVIEQLPTTKQWGNVSLKNTSRAILNENGGNTTSGGTLPSDFNYLNENTNFFSSVNKIWAWWLENPRYSTNDAWNVNSSYRRVPGDPVSYDSGNGVRPAIEVSKTNIAY